VAPVGRTTSKASDVPPSMCTLLIRGQGPSSPSRQWHAHGVTMGRARRSGHAGEALPLQFHIAGPHRGVGSSSRRRAFAACAGQSRRPQAVNASAHVVGRPMLASRQGPQPGRAGVGRDRVLAGPGRSAARPRRSLMPQSPIDDLSRRRIGGVILALTDEPQSTRGRPGLRGRTRAGHHARRCRWHSRFSGQHDDRPIRVVDGILLAAFDRRGRATSVRSWSQEAFGQSDLEPKR
jgi:hypothetical protein